MISVRLRTSSKADSCFARPTSSRGSKPTFRPPTLKAGNGSEAWKPENHRRSAFLVGVAISRTSATGAALRAAEDWERAMAGTMPKEGGR